ncbi:MAG: hypothetical protein WCI05_03335 [Myxococcales bacterium]
MLQRAEVLAFALCAFAGNLSAAEPIRDNNYSMELYQGPVLAPIRVTGLGGAYAAAAEGVEGAAVNAASPAVREAYSPGWWDHDISLGASVLSTLGNTDFDNRGPTQGGTTKSRVGDFYELSFGLNLQFGYWGTTATAQVQQYNLAAQSGLEGLTMQVWRFKALLAYGLLGGQLVVGGGVRVALVSISMFQGISTPNELLRMLGAGPELGVVVLPDRTQWRLGATVRTPITVQGSGGDTDPTGVRHVGSIVLPGELRLPWEAELGVAYQLGPRPLNPSWPNPRDQEADLRRRIDLDRTGRQVETGKALTGLQGAAFESARLELERQEQASRALEDQELAALSDRLRAVRKARYANWPRERILLLASVLVTGSSDNSVSVAGFLEQKRELVGQTVSFAPRFGMEGEPLHDRMKLRVGTYLEPSRYPDGTARQHVTFGADVKLFPFNVWGLVGATTWRLSSYLDVAPRYINGGIGLGVWR